MMTLDCNVDFVINIIRGQNRIVSDKPLTKKPEDSGIEIAEDLERIVSCDVTVIYVNKLSFTANALESEPETDVLIFLFS